MNQHPKKTERKTLKLNMWNDKFSFAYFPIICTLKDFVKYFLVIELPFMASFLCIFFQLKKPNTLLLS